jgi:hypothetical protein
MRDELRVKCDVAQTVVVSGDQSQQRSWPQAVGGDLGWKSPSECEAQSPIVLLDETQKPRLTILLLDGWRSSAVLASWMRDGNFCLHRGRALLVGGPVDSLPV